MSGALMANASFDVVVVGGGIVGVATAHNLARTGDHRVAVLEAGPGLGLHQTGRNSGVIHSGLYYRPGSQKATLCAAGRRRMYEFCASHEIPFRACGKLVVATAEQQLAGLAQLQNRAATNGLEGIERLDSSAIRHFEPAAVGIAGLWVPQTGVVDFAMVTAELARQFRQAAGAIFLDSRVQQIAREAGLVHLKTRQQDFQCRLLINCAGLQADRVARRAGLEPDVRLIPFRGEYSRIEGTSRDLVRGLIYPVPDPRFPFLGVHLTRTLDDRVLLGPNAVPALKREGYHWTDVSLRDVADTLGFPGFWRLARSFWRTGLAETRRSLSRRALIEETQRLVPGISHHDLYPHPSGVRAQAVDRAGNLLDDFCILQTETMIHVLNAPSPAATASLAIGEHIAHLARNSL
jgi:L-2-hydroxyglutarate oxidase